MAVPWSDRGWPGSLPALAQVAYAQRPRKTRCIELNTLEWGLGASNPALGFYFASGNELGAIRNAANSSDGTTTTPISFQMAGDGQLSQETLSLSLTLLNMYPLTQFTSADRPDFLNAYIIVLTDNRWFMQWQATPPWSPIIPAHGLTNSPYYLPSPTWQDLIDQCATATGASIVNDPIPSTYLQPDETMNLAGVPIGITLDAICANLGFKFVANFDGSYNMQDAENAMAARQGDIDGNPNRTSPAGGLLYQDNL